MRLLVQLQEREQRGILRSRDARKLHGPDAASRECIQLVHPPFRARVLSEWMKEKAIREQINMQTYLFCRFFVIVLV